MYEDDMLCCSALLGVPTIAKHIIFSISKFGRKQQNIPKAQQEGGGEIRDKSWPRISVEMIIEK
jgi:hypothetical protein